MKKNRVGTNPMFGAYFSFNQETKLKKSSLISFLLFVDRLDGYFLGRNTKVFLNAKQVLVFLRKDVECVK